MIIKVGLDLRVLNYSMKYLLKYKGLLFIYMFVNAGLMIVTVISPYITGRIINMLTGTSSLEYLYSYIALISMVWVMDILLGLVNNIITAKLRIDSTYAMCNEIVKHIHKSSFIKVNSVDPMYLNQRINQDTGNCINFAINVITNITTNTITAAVMLALIYKISSKITFILICLVIIYYYTYVMVKKTLSDYTKKHKEAQNLFFAKMGEQIRYTRFVKLHSLQVFFEKRFENAYVLFRTTALQFRKLICFLTSIDYVIKCAANVALFVIGGKEIISGNISLGTFLMVSSYFPKIINSLSYYFQVGKIYQDTLVSYNRLKEILNWEQETYGSYVPDQISEICLSDFSFTYNNIKILSNLSLIFKKGHIYGIVGKNGTGKSTLVQAISGLFFNDYTGDILINGVTMKNCDMYKIRDKFYSVVEQEPMLLNDSIATNLFLNHCKNRERAYEIYQLMGLTLYFDSLSDGLETIISPTNDNISGGEKQKISLVRALLKESEVVILDEPTSALDEKTIEKLLQYLQINKKNKIVILVTHDLRVINICDSVVELS